MSKIAQGQKGMQTLRIEKISNHRRHAFRMTPITLSVLALHASSWD